MHQNSVACRHTAFDEVLVSLVTHFVELAIACRGYPESESTKRLACQYYEEAIAAKDARSS